MPSSYATTRSAVSFTSRVLPRRSVGHGVVHVLDAGLCPTGSPPFNSIVITCFQRTAIIGLLSMNGHHHGPFTERRYGKHDNGTNTGYTRYHLSETPLPKTVIIHG